MIGGRIRKMEGNAEPDVVQKPVTLNGEVIGRITKVGVSEISKQDIYQADVDLYRYLQTHTQCDGDCAVYYKEYTLSEWAVVFDRAFGDASISGSFIPRRQNWTP